MEIDSFLEQQCELQAKQHEAKRAGGVDVTIVSPAAPLLLRDVPGLSLSARDWSRLAKLIPQSACMDIPCTSTVDSTSSTAAVAAAAAAAGDPQAYITTVSLFRFLRLKLVPEYVSTAITHWALGLRPAVLLTRIPSARRMLDLQCSGQRGVTAFTRLEDLQRVYKDHYPPYQQRNSVEFLMHDLQHMEQLAHPWYYAEQVGFCSLMRDAIDNAMLLGWKHNAQLPPGSDAKLAQDVMLDGGQLSASSGSYAKNAQDAILTVDPLSASCGAVSANTLDAAFFDDVDHAISDMNACCVHLLSFVKAKLLLAFKRRALATAGGSPARDEDAQLPADFIGSDVDLSVDSSRDFDACYAMLLDSVWRLPTDMRAACVRLCTDSFRPLEDGSIIRRFCHDRGCQVLGVPYPFLE